MSESLDASPRLGSRKVFSGLGKCRLSGNKKGERSKANSEGNL